MSVQSLRRLAAIVAGILCVVAAPDRSAAAQERAPLDLIVNRVSRGQVVAVLRQDEVWVAVHDLEEAGLHGFAGEREMIDRVPWVRLASLRPGLSFELDERALELRLTATTDWLDRQRLDLQTERPVGMTYSHNASAFLNYGVNAESGTGYALVADAGFSAGGALFTTSMVRSPAQPLVRGQSTVTIDNRRRLQRWTIGDAFASTGLLGGGAFLGGIGVSREYGLDPYLLRFPTLDMSGEVDTPSTLEIYVNDRLVRREDLPPGRFDVASLPASAGRATARLVLRDAFGGEREIVSRFYMTSGVLAATQHEYSYNIGYERQNSSVSSWDYATPAFLARHRYGVSDRVTIGFRSELDPHTMNGGPTLNLRLPMGEIEATAAGSRSGSLTGTAAALAYAFVSTPFSFGASIRVQSPSYATVSLRSSDPRTRLETNVYAAIPAGPRVSVTLRHAVSDGPVLPTNVSSAAVAFRVSRRMNLSLTAANDWRDHLTGRQLFIGLGLMTGSRTTINVSHDSEGSTNHTNIDAQQSLPNGTGYGYRMSADADHGGASGALQYQGPYGRYEIARDLIDGRQTTSVHAAGGVVAIGGGVYATRPVQDGFALIRVPDVGGVRAYASNQEIGRTDRHGDVLVPGLLPYYGNRLSIADDDIPLDRIVGNTEQVIAPPFRGGAVITFAAPRARATAGLVVLARGNESVVPAFGQLVLRLDGHTFESPIGTLGEFYFESAPAGRYAADVIYEQRTCTFTFVIPEAATATSDIGTVRCVDTGAQR